MFNDKKSLWISAYAISTIMAQADITGTVYKDFNLDGQKNGEDSYVSGVSIKAVCEDANTYTATTDANGAYTLTGFPAGNKCRVEVNPSNVGVAASSNVQGSAPLVDMVLDGSVHQVSVGSPTTYCQNNANVVMAALPGYYTPGDNTYKGGGSESPNGHHFGVLFDIKTPEIGTFNNVYNITDNRKKLVTWEQVGAIWGVAWKRSTKDLFASAVLKRYVPLKDESSSAAISSSAGTIYKIDTQNGNQVSTLVTITNVLTAESATKLLTRHYDIHQHGDTDVVVYAGRQGLGDLDISEDETKLYTVNLNTKQLIIIDAKNGTILQSIALPNPYGNGICEDAMVRPWAIKTRGDNVYIGSVCENKITIGDSKDITNKNGVGAAIQEYNGAIIKTLAITNSLRYLRPHNYNPIDVIRYYDINDNWGNPDISPILADIEFTNNGDMVLGYINRTAFNRNVTLMGDIRKMCLNSDGTYTDESSDVQATTCKSHEIKYNQNNKNNNTYYSFYVGDYLKGEYGHDNHPETAIGALAQMPGAPYIMLAMTNSTSWYEPGGIGLLSNTSGEKIAAQATINSFHIEGDVNGEVEPYGSKSGGMGDIEILCDPAPLEIGNYVWEDSNKDGIQDPNEAALSGVVVNLYEAEDLVGTTTTDAKGHYYFGGINHTHMTNNNPVKTHTAYQVKIALNDAALGGRVPTVKDANTNTEDQRDSDGDNGSIDVASSTITFGTGAAGQNNHNLDFGFKKLEPSIDIEKTTNSIDADTQAQAVSLKTGDVVTWGYIVTNNGNETLVDIETNDDKEGAIVCPKTRLQVDENMTCTSKIGEAGTQNYENTATVTAKGETSNTAVTDSDKSHYKVTLEEPVITPESPTSSTYHIGTHFWIDTNANGILDTNEKPIAGALIELFDAKGVKIAETTTDANGQYGFDIPAGNYKVKFNIPNKAEYKGFIFSNQGNNTDNNRNVNNANTAGFTQSVTVGPNTKNEDLTLDAGINCGCANVSTDSADAQSILSMLFMMLFTLMTALYYVRKEEIAKGKKQNV